MINLLNNNLAYVICFALVVLVGSYFGIVWLTRETVRDELKLIQQRRNKKRKQLYEKHQKELEYQRRKQQHENQRERPQSDMDSYVDPAERYNGEQEDEEDNRHHPSGYSGTRLDKNDISMRDIADGVR